MKAIPILVICIAPACAHAADPPQSQPATSTALHWLEKAEAAAQQIDNTERDSFPPRPRDFALRMVAVAYLEIGHIDRARAVAAKLPEDDRPEIDAMVPISLAHAGRFDAALREARALNHGWILSLVAQICAKTDVRRALQIAEEVPNSHRGATYAEIAKQQVLKADVDGARETAAKIQELEYKRQARPWLVAGGLVERGGEIRQAAKKHMVKIEEIQRELSAICQAKAKAGQLAAVRRILKALSKPQHRSSAYVALARVHLAGAERQSFQKAVDQALAEVSAIKGGPTAALARAARYTEIAALQVRAGDIDAAARTIRLAHRSGEEESKAWEPLGDGMGVFENLGGKLALIGLLMEAGKLEEGRRLATGEDGSVMSQAVPLLVQAYAARGRTGEVEQLLRSVPPGEAEYQVYLAAARGASEHTRAASRPAQP